MARRGLNKPIMIVTEKSSVSASRIPPKRLPLFTRMVVDAAVLAVTTWTGTLVNA